MKKIIVILAFLITLGLVYATDVPYDGFDRAVELVVREPVEKLEPEVKEMEMLVFGDMMLGRHVRTLMDRNGMDYPLENLGLEVLMEGVDLVVGNLEGPIRGEGRKGGTSMVFAFNKDIAPWLKEKGFDLVSLANNHTWDAGEAGYQESVDELEKAGVRWCGHPRDEEGQYVNYGEVEGLSYAFICLHDVTFKLDLEKALALIEEVDQKVDQTVVYIHWAYEYKNTANDFVQVEPGRKFVGAGADLVIGHHPHVIQNFEIYEGVPIFYSLGNFIFDQYFSREVQEQLGLKIKMGVEGVEEIELLPMKSDYSQSRLMSEEERLEWVERFIEYGNYEQSVQEMLRDGILVL